MSTSLNLTDGTSMTFPTTSAVVARTDAAQTFTGTQTFSGPIVGTQTAGDNSTKAASTAYVDSQFASGTWTPIDSSGASLSLTGAVGFYRKAPGLVTVWGSYTQPTTSNGNTVLVGGLPYTSANLSIQNGRYLGTIEFGGGGGTPGGSPELVYVNSNGTTVGMSYAGGVAMHNSDISGYAVNFAITYPI